MSINLSILKSAKFNYELGKKTWFGTGGKCTLFFEPKKINELIYILKYGKKVFPIFIIGSGSNLIVRDGGLKGIVIRLSGDFKKIDFHTDDLILSVGAGAKDSEVSKFCLENEITGLEFLSGIPGTIGGNLMMNAGCYGQEISDNLIDCTIIDKRLRLKKLKKDEIDFSYRKSSFQKNQVIIDARFKIKKINKNRIKETISKISKKRKQSQPIANRTGGSTFSNPNSQSAWKLIDNVNYRGKQFGGARVSDLHSNFLINYNNATSLDLEMLGEEIRKMVWEKNKIKLDWELLRIGKFKKI